LILKQADLSYRLVQMTGDHIGAVETLTPGVDFDDIQITWRALYLTKKSSSSGSPDGGTTGNSTDGASSVLLTVRSIGEQPGQTFEMPASGILYPAPNDVAFAYMVTDGKQPGYFLYRRDGSFKRIVPWPKGVSSTDPFGKGSYFWDSGRGNIFYDRDANGRVVGHDSRSNLDTDLGIRPRYAGWIDSRTLISCGTDGLRLVTADGKTPERILDDQVCQQSLLFVSNGFAYYEVGNTVRKTKLDGSAPPQQLYDFGQNRVLIIQPPKDVIIYSTDPDDRYALGAGDAWIGNWRFVERGTAISFVDQQKLYWLEHSAQNSGAGELTMLTMPAPDQPGGTPRRLARNVRQYDLLGDGRILCDDNHAFNGVFNRIVVIDPEANTSTWVASSSNYFSSIPDTNDYIVDVVSGATGHDVVRVSIPPKTGK
jgi:hypothetical protein